MYCAKNSVVCILPFTVKFCVITAEPVIFTFPFTANPPLMEVGTFTTNPLFGEMFATAEPDLIWSKSPNEDANILKSPLPSPLYNDADIDEDMFKEPESCTSPPITIGELPNEFIS